MEYQFKCVSDIKTESLGMADWLRRLFFLTDPANKLRENGVVLETVEDMPNTDSYFNIDWQFQNGLTMTFYIKPDYKNEQKKG
ncbi:phage neck terminator protein [Fructilactobacillus florum]|nr:hypothetical protein [Fructilactobacillus florum]